MSEHRRKREREAVDRFIRWVTEMCEITYRVTAEEVVVDPSTGTNYDFHLVAMQPGHPELAVELFRLVESEDAAASDRRREQLWVAIKTEFEAAGITDISVQTAFDVAVLGRDAKRAARDLVTAFQKAQARDPNAKEYPLLSDYLVEKWPGLGLVSCVATGDVRAINAVEIAAPEFAKNLRKKNAQLSVSGPVRVVLAENWSPMVGVGDAIEALALMDTSALTHIDRVYFERKDNEFSLLYSRSVRDACVAGDVPDAPDERALFEDWLRIRLQAHEDSAFRRALELVKGAGTLSLIANKFTRAAILAVACKRVDAGDLETGHTLLPLAAIDPDPCLVSEANDPEGVFNYHERTIAGDDNFPIATVRGWGCWLAQKLISRENDPTGLEPVIRAVRDFAYDPNAYIRRMATYSLVMLAQWRDRRAADGEFVLSVPIRDEILSLAFGMLRANKNIRRILDGLAPVFWNMPDLTAAHVAEVFDSLNGNVGHDASLTLAGFLLYHAELRPIHAPNTSFDPTDLRTRLRSTLTRYAPLRCSMAYALFREHQRPTKPAPAALDEIAFMLPEGGDEGPVLHYFFVIAIRLLEQNRVSPLLDSAILLAIQSLAGEPARSEQPVVSTFDVAALWHALENADRWDLILSSAELLASSTKPLDDPAALISFLRSAPRDRSQQADHLIAHLANTP